MSFSDTRIDEVGTAVFVAFDTPERMRDSLLHEVWGDPGVWLRYAREFAHGDAATR